MQDAGGALVHQFLADHFLLHGGHHDYLGVRVQRAQFREGFQAGLAGHDQVQQHQVGFELREKLHGLVAVAGLAHHLVAHFGQQVLYHAPGEDIVVYQQYFHKLGSLKPLCALKSRLYTKKRRAAGPRPSGCSSAA